MSLLNVAAYVLAGVVVGVVGALGYVVWYFRDVFG